MKTKSIILFKTFTILASVVTLLLYSSPPAEALPLTPGEEQYLPWGTYGPCHPAATHIRTRGIHVIEAGMTLSNVPTDGINVLECRPFDGPGGTFVVPCPLNTLYSYCLRNQNDGVGNHVYLGVTETQPEQLTPQIDIKPGGFPNSINPENKGKIPVAILSTDATDNTISFDATTVDPITVRFGPTGTEAAPVQHALEDIDGDGDTDIILRFNTEDTDIECGDTSATLIGETFSGQAIQGTDSIRTVGCK